MNRHREQTLDADECKYCDAELTPSRLSDAVSELRGLDPSHFNVCAECLVVEDRACWSCDGAVYVPASLHDADEGDRPNICPECRYEYCTDDYDPFDPGWRID